jgi:hypothetical protein
MQSLEHLNTSKAPNIGLTNTQRKTVKQLEAFYKQGNKWFSVLTGLEEKKEKTNKK